MNGSGLVCLKRHPLGYQANSQRYCSLTKHGGSAWWIVHFPFTRGTKMVNAELNLEEKESSAVWDYGMGSCSKAPCGAVGQGPVERREGGTPLIEGEHLSSSSQAPKNLEGLTETVGTLGLQVSRRSRCGAAKRRARRAGLAEAPTGDSSGGQPRSAPGGQSQTQQGPAYLGLNKDEDLLWLSGRPRRVEVVCETQANGSGRPGALRGRAGREAQDVWAAWLCQSRSGRPPDGCCWRELPKESNLWGELFRYKRRPNTLR
jgi:hypothetical protein